MISEGLLTISLVSGLISLALREIYWRAGWVEGTRSSKKDMASRVYAGVLGAGAMLLIGHSWDPGVYLILALYLGILVSFSIVDVEEKVIPRYVWGAGLLIALFSSYVFPQLYGQDSGRLGLWEACLGSVAGGGVIFAMVEFGKLLFGQLKIEPDSPCPYGVEKREGRWVFSSEGEIILLEDVIMRKKDRIIIENEDGTQFKISETEFDDGGESRPLEVLSGVARRIIIPREAMGFGDVKFMLMAGAMTGWQGAIFSIFAGAVIGSVVGGFLRFARGSNEIPFVPFLSAGVLIYFTAPDHVSLIFDLMLAKGVAE